MRIALVCPYDCTVPGGVQTQVLALARALQSRGDDVVVVAPADRAARPGLLDDTALSGAGFLRVGQGVAISVNGSRAPVSPFPATMRRTVAALRQFGPEVTHVHEPFVPGASLAAVLWGPRPVVGTFHRSGADFAYRCYGHLVGRWADHLSVAVAVSEEASATAQRCVGHLPEIRIIPNGVEVARLASAEPWPKGAPTVVFVGRHEPRKGLAVLLEAFAGLPGATCLWVLGEGPETARLRTRFGADSRIEWVGPVDDAQRARRVAGADVFVAPSLGGESFGVVLLEAMAAGTAVVASDLLGYRRACEGAARLVPPGDSTALRRAIGEMLADPLEREGFARKGRARALECDMALTADSYREIYASLERAGRR